MHRWQAYPPYELPITWLRMQEVEERLPLEHHQPRRPLAVSRFQKVHRLFFVSEIGISLCDLVRRNIMLASPRSDVVHSQLFHSLFAASLKRLAFRLRQGCVSAEANCFFQF